jgi:hypothetical protein
MGCLKIVGLGLWLVFQRVEEREQCWVKMMEMMSVEMMEI